MLTLTASELENLYQRVDDATLMNESLNVTHAELIAVVDLVEKSNQEARREHVGTAHEIHVTAASMAYVTIQIVKES